MLGYFIVWLFFFSCVALIVLYAYLNKVNDIYYQKITFMNTALNDDNLTNYQLNKVFVQTGNLSNLKTPVLIKKNLANFDYREIVNNYKSKVKVLKILRVISILVLLITSVLIFVPY